MIGYKKPECSLIAPRFDTGIKFADPNNPNPENVLFGGGVRAGVRWDGTFYRDQVRYPAGGDRFWCSYFKPGSAPGIKNGYWINFGKGWAHLHNDDPAQVRQGAAQSLDYDSAAGQWVLLVQATQYVTHEIIEVWRGIKQGGNDPTGTYTRISGLDPLASLTIEAV